MGHAIFANTALKISMRDGLFVVSGLADEDIYFTPHAFLMALNNAHRVYDEWAHKQCSVLLPACKGCEKRTDATERDRFIPEPCPDRDFDIGV